MKEEEKSSSQPRDLGEGASGYKELAKSEAGSFEQERRARLRSDMAELARPVNVLFADETGKDYDAYRKPIPPEAAAAFRIDAQKAEIEDTPTAAAELAKLPFINDREIEIPERTSSTLMYDVEFPVDRIVSAAGFTSWAGREGDKLSEGYSGRKRPSAEVIIEEYAPWMKQQGEVPSIQGSQTLAIFEDSNGERWAVARDGTHRIAAAKFNGTAHIKAAVEINEPIPTLPYSVLERFGDSA